MGVKTRNHELVYVYLEPKQGPGCFDWSLGFSALPFGGCNRFVDVSAALCWGNWRKFDLVSTRRCQWSYGHLFLFLVGEGSKLLFLPRAIGVIGMGVWCLYLLHIKKLTYRIEIYIFPQAGFFGRRCFLLFPYMVGDSHQPFRGFMWPW